MLQNAEDIESSSCMRTTKIEQMEAANIELKLEHKIKLEQASSNAEEAICCASKIEDVTTTICNYKAEVSFGVLNGELENLFS